jgi:hypothetical protein
MFDVFDGQFSFKSIEFWLRNPILGSARMPANEVTGFSPLTLYCRRAKELSTRIELNGGLLWNMVGHLAATKLRLIA